MEFDFDLDQFEGADYVGESNLNDRELAQLERYGSLVAVKVA